MIAVCALCEVPMKVDRIGVLVGEFMDDNLSLYTIRAGDVMRCPECGAEIICRWGENPVSASHEGEKHEAVVKKWKEGRAADARMFPAAFNRRAPRPEWARSREDIVYEGLRERMTDYFNVLCEAFVKFFPEEIKDGVFDRFKKTMLGLIKLLRRDVAE